MKYFKLASLSLLTMLGLKGSSLEPAGPDAAEIANAENYKVPKMEGLTYSYDSSARTMHVIGVKGEIEFPIDTVELYLEGKLDQNHIKKLENKTGKELEFKTASLDKGAVSGFTCMYYIDAFKSVLDICDDKELKKMVEESKKPATQKSKQEENSPRNFTKFVTTESSKGPGRAI